MSDEEEQFYNKNDPMLRHNLPPFYQEWKEEIFLLPWKELKLILFNESLKNRPKKSMKIEERSSMTIPYGFQSLNFIQVTQDSLKSVLPMFQGNDVIESLSQDSFATLDSQYITLWRGSHRTKKMAVLKEKEGISNSESGKSENGQNSAGCVGVTHWIWVGKYKLFIVATSFLQLKVINHQSFFVSSKICIKLFST